MKFSVLAFSTMTVALLAGCSGIVTPKSELASHEPGKNIPAIDNMIVSLKQEYIDKCYMPVQAPSSRKSVPVRTFPDSGTSL